MPGQCGSAFRWKAIHEASCLRLCVPFRQGLLRSLESLPKAFPDISPHWITNRGRVMAFFHAVFGPVYNKNLVPANRVPRKWGDLLSPVWKDKMIMSTGFDQFTALAETWGVERVREFLHRLKGQNVALQRGATAVLQRVAVGEFPMAATQLYGTMTRIRRKGAPLEMAFLEPVPVATVSLVLPKNSPHPNAGLLFVAFIMSPRGHALWEELSGFSSIFVKTSSAAKMLKGKKLALMSPEWALKSDRLESQWAEALGAKTK